MNTLSSGFSKVKIPPFLIVIAVAWASYTINVKTFLWVSLIHEIGHFTVGWLTLNPSWIVSMTETRITYDTWMVRMGGFIAWWIFTYSGIRSRIPVLIGLAIAVAIDSLMRIKYQTDFDSDTIVIAYIMIELTAILGGIIHGRREGKELEERTTPGERRPTQADSARNTRGISGAPKDVPRWIEEALRPRGR